MNSAQIRRSQFLPIANCHLPAIPSQLISVWFDFVWCSNHAHQALRSMPYDDQVKPLIGDHPLPGQSVRALFLLFGSGCTYWLWGQEGRFTLHLNEPQKSLTT